MQGRVSRAGVMMAAGGWRSVAVASAAACLLAGCALARPQAAVKSAAQPDPVWPLPPEPARIAYVGSMRQPSDFGVRISLWGRFFNWMTGSLQGNEPLGRPFGIALDEQDNLCLTDTAANAVLCIDRDRKHCRRWDRVGRIRFLSPVAVAKRGATLFVADSGLGAVVAFREDGRLLCQITNRLERPTGIALDGAIMFVADATRHRVVVFNLRGQYLSEFGERGSGPGEFNFPTHVAADGRGTLLVTDSMNGRVQAFSREGAFLRQIGGPGDVPGYFGRPKGVAADSLGHAYVVDGGFDNFQIFSTQGRILLSVGSAGDGPGQFWLPNGIAVSRRGEVFVADTYNRRVQVFQTVGQP